MFKWLKNLFSKLFGKKEKTPTVKSEVTDVKKETPVKEEKVEETPTIEKRLESYEEYVKKVSEKYDDIVTDIDHKIPYATFTYACELVINKGLSVVQAAKEVKIGSTTLYMFINESLFHVDQDLYYRLDSVLEERRKANIERAKENLRKYRESKANEE